MAEDEGFIIMLHDRAEAAGPEAHAALIDWLGNDATHLLLRAGVKNGWEASCFTPPRQVHGEPNMYGITVYYL